MIVESLQLAQRSRIGLQLAVSFLFIMCIVYAYNTTPAMFEAMPSGPGNLPEPKVWTIVLMSVLSLIPAVFIFFLLKREFHFVGDKELDDEPKYIV